MAFRLCYLLLALCLPAVTLATEPDAGTMISVERLRWYPAWYLRAGLWYARLPEKMPISTGTTLYRLTYRTRDWNGEPIEATGLVAVPHKRPLRGIVSYQHGTTTQRSAVPGNASIDGRLMAAAFAGGGYLLVAADYIGMGGTPRIQPYLHAGSAARASADMLTAAREFLASRSISLPNRLNLIGFSQGGHATAALQRALESKGGSTVVAAATVAAPLDLAAISFPTALQGGAKSHTVYLAYMVYAYAVIYGEAIDAIIAEPYASRLATAFDGNHDNDAIKALLPQAPRDLFTPAFLAAFDAGESTWLSRALVVNEVFRWAPRAPLRLYFGSRDRDVAPAEATTAAAAMTALGGNVQAIDVGPYDHEDSAFHSIADIRRWFDGLNPPLK